ncbi:uncharacterized protein LOC112904281 [Agrilus planipennis]|uniref:Uncharacterized protein LOC112904281 n=1 Tax=Agrilus planipennis TaxID=224129 RepID=A0A7F5R3E2_AGRPL|nr:uncharacterized protein LOC112904281 [Agrilus planipennis]
MEELCRKCLIVREFSFLPFTHFAKFRRREKGRQLPFVPFDRSACDKSENDTGFCRELLPRCDRPLPRTKNADQNELVNYISSLGADRMPGQRNNRYGIPDQSQPTSSLPSFVFTETMEERSLCFSQ